MLQFFSASGFFWVGFGVPKTPSNMVFGAQGGILGYQGDFYYAVIFLHPPGLRSGSQPLIIWGSRKKSNPNKKGHENCRIPR